MSQLADLFGKFHAAMLYDDAAAVAPSIKPNPKLSPEKQLAIYIDGYRTRLLAAIRSDYPELAALLGDKFDVLALDYIAQNPPSHFNLDRYPHNFAAFLRTQLRDAFAADLASLEGAIAEVFMLPESEALQPAAITPENFAALVLKPRTASRLLVLQYPVDAYFSSIRTGGAPKRPEPETHGIFIVRHDNEVKRHVLGGAEYALLTKLCNGQAVGEALTEADGEHLQQWFSRWLANGFFRAEAL